MLSKVLQGNIQNNFLDSVVKEYSKQFYEYRKGQE